MISAPAWSPRWRRSSMPWSAPSRRSRSPCSTSTCAFARKVSISTRLRVRPRRALRRPKRLRRGALAPILLLLFGLLAALHSAPVSASSADDYTNAVHRALTLVQFAERGDLPSVQQAIDVLVQGTGGSQPEILSALRQSPPDLAQANQRLQALYGTLQARVDTPNPAAARDPLR